MLPKGKLDSESLDVTRRSRSYIERQEDVALSSYSSNDKSADEVEVGDKVGDWTMSCRKDGRSGAGVSVFAGVCVSASTLGGAGARAEVGKGGGGDGTDDDPMPEVS